MYYVALRMLMGDTVKYLALVFGLAFSTLLVVQQGSIFTGIMRRTSANIETIPQADIWVMDPATRYYDEHRPIEDTALNRVRGVDGVDWAEKLFLGGGEASLPDGTFAHCLIVGVDRNSKIGLPDMFTSGSPHGLELPDGVLWDNLGLELYKKIKDGDVLEINDRRAIVVGQVAAKRAFLSNPTIYTTYERALEYAPGERKRLTFVVVHCKPGTDKTKIARNIERVTALGAKTTDEFFWSTVVFFLKNTGITINFGITILLGMIVGIAIAGQTFFTFTIENTKQFGALKAMGVSNWKLVKMVMLQALLVGVIGWGIGVGLTGLFGMRTSPRTIIAFLMTPQLLAISFLIMILTILGAALVSIRRVLSIEPAIVFR